MGMLIEELTVPILVDLAKRPLGLRMLDGMLRENNKRMHLLTGERMVIAEAIAGMAAQTRTEAGAEEGWQSTRVSGISLGDAGAGSAAATGQAVFNLHARMQGDGQTH